MYGFIKNNAINNIDILGYINKEYVEKILRRKVAKVKHLYNRGKRYEAAVEAEKMYWLLALGGTMTGKKMSGMFMRMWLDKSRHDYEMTQAQLAQVLKSKPVRDSIIRSLYNSKKSGKKLVRKWLRPIYTAYRGGVLVLDKDIHYALGEFSFYFTGCYSVSDKTENKVKIIIDGSFEIQDIYDWRNPGQKFVTLKLVETGNGVRVYDKWAENVENWGFATPFLVRGTITVHNELFKQYRPFDYF